MLKRMAVWHGFAGGVEGPGGTARSAARGQFFRKPAARRAAPGFTLLEVLVALALSGVMLAVLAGSYQESARAQQILTGRVTGLMLGRSKLAELMQGSEKASSGEFAPPYGNYRWQSREELSGGRPRDGETSGPAVEAPNLMITVEWRNGNAPPQHVTLRGYPNPGAAAP